MKPSSTKHSSVQNRVPNNPQADQLLTGGNNWDSKTEAQARKKTLYDATSRSSYYRTHAGHWKQRDEPDEAEQDRQADRINQVLKSQRQRASRERLKQKPGGVPVRRDGKKLFDEFINEARSRQITTKTPSVTSKDLKTLKNLYNAATYLEFHQWLILVADEGI